jgi:hypothetical protein
LSEAAVSREKACSLPGRRRGDSLRAAYLMREAMEYKAGNIAYKKKTSIIYASISPPDLAETTTRR